MNIKDIAKLANVSKSTVSRVLNNSQSVNEEMQNRVLKVIEETGYQPNALAKELVSKETKLIGVIVPRINTVVFSDIVEGIMQHLSAFGYNVILLCSKADEAEEIKHLEFLQKKQVDGIIFFPGNMTFNLQNLINNINTPLVIMGLDDPVVKKSVILYDEFESSKSMVSHFIDQGHKKIAFIGIDKNRSPVGQDRKDGYMEALKSRDIDFNPDYIYEGSFALESGYEGTKQIFNQSKETPTAIFAATDHLAIGVINYLRKEGIVVPDDVVVAGFDDVEISSYLNPSITSVRFDYFRSGEIASKFILETIEDPTVIRKYTIGFQIIHRDSTRIS